MYKVPTTTMGHDLQRRPWLLARKIVGYWFSASVISGLVLGGLYGSLFYAGIGTLIGGVLGLLGGALCGLLGGLLLAIVTRVRFLPITNLERYSRAVLITMSLNHLVSGFFIIPWAFFSLGEGRFLMPWDSLTGIGGGQESLMHAIFSSGALMLSGIPSVLAALSVLVWRDSYIAWYSRTA